MNSSVPSLRCEINLLRRSIQLQRDPYIPQRHGVLDDLDFLPRMDVLANSKWANTSPATFSSMTPREYMTYSVRPLTVSNPGTM